MAFKDIRKLRKIEEVKVEKKYFRHLVVGADFFALRLYRELVKKYGKSEVGFFSFVEPNIDNYKFKGPSLLRGEQNLEVLKNELPENVLASDQLGPSLFYKEMRLREFGGRSKSEKLLWSEDFFTTPRLKLNEDNFLKYFDLNELEEDFFTGFIHLVPSSIGTYESSDLIEDAKWKIDCTDGAELLCTNLYWGESPAKFLELVTDKSQLSSKQIEFFESTQTPCSLYVRFLFDNEITDKEETFFIPLSYTHDWGHFIGEFNKESGFKEIEFFSYIDKNDATDDDVAKKIRLLKKSFEKIFNDSKKMEFREFITLWDESLCLKVNDSLYPFSDEKSSNLHFFSIQAPLREDDSSEQEIGLLSGIARGLLVEKKLNLEIGLS